MAEKRVLMIAGPNGAGKSTFAGEYLPKEGNCIHFVNADLIAAGLSPFDPAQAAIRAGRLMLQEIDRYAKSRYKRLVDAWVLYDNSGVVPLLIDEGRT